MRTSIATVCLAGTLEEKLDACASAGFDGVEIFAPDLLVSPSSPEEIRARCAGLGLAIDLYQPFRDAEGVPEEEFADTLRRARATFATMERLGAGTLLVCSNVGTASIDDDALAAEQLHRLAVEAEPFGIRLAYEALAWGRYVDDYERAWRIVRDADHPLLGTCLDSFHILSRGADPAGIEAIPPEKIFIVQLADAPALTMDVLSWSRHHRVFPGQGSWDLPGFLAHLVRAGYTGPVSLEVFNDVFRQARADRTAVDAMRSLRLLQDRTAALLRDDERDDERDDAPGGMRLATLPRVEDPAGFDFVEIRGERLGPVEDLLAGLGFTYDGSHRTKHVRLWSLGEARIIVNDAPTPGPGPVVAAIGFVVDDPARAASRALQLDAPVVPRRSEADEQVLQAVRAPDGTEVFFCSSTRAWTGEFALAPGDPRARANAGAEDGDGCVVDHVNLAQPWQHFDEGVLFLSGALSLEPQPSLDVASPLGLVRSQVMRTDDGRVRLALNVAPPIAQQGDSGLRQAQHVALSCPDIVGLARRARERGLPFLAVPANYYDDLAARFDLAPEQIARLRDLDLLYDRDGDGEFVHFYTLTVGDVFLEVVQRLGDYDGYGAPNAPVRLAIQHGAA